MKYEVDFGSQLIPLLHAVQQKAGQKPEQQQAAQAEPDRSREGLESLQEKMGAAGLADRGDRPASLAAPTPAAVAQPQTSRFEQVFAQSQVQMLSALSESMCRTLLPFVLLAYENQCTCKLFQVNNLYSSLRSCIWLTLIDRPPCSEPQPCPRFTPTADACDNSCLICMDCKCDVCE